MTNNLHETVKALRDAKDNSGVQAIADKAIADMRNGLKATWQGRLDVIDAIKAIRDESLYAFAYPEGSETPYAGWKPLVKAIFKAETAGWDKGIRNAWAVTLVDLTMTQAEAADALNVSEATVRRACVDAEQDASGEGGKGDTRKASESKSDADKLTDALKKAMGSVTDTTKFTVADLVDMAAIARDFVAACQNEKARRDLIDGSPARQRQRGNNPRTGAPAPETVPA